MRVCLEGGEEVGSKAQDVAERASGDLARTCIPRFTCSQQTNCKKTIGLVFPTSQSKVC